MKQILDVGMYALPDEATVARVRAVFEGMGLQVTQELRTVKVEVEADRGLIARLRAALCSTGIDLNEYLSIGSRTVYERCEVERSPWAELKVRSGSVKPPYRTDRACRDCGRNWAVSNRKWPSQHLTATMIPERWMKVVSMRKKIVPTCRKTRDGLLILDSEMYCALRENDLLGLEIHEANKGCLYVARPEVVVIPIADEETYVGLKAPCALCGWAVFDYIAGVQTFRAKTLDMDFYCLDFWGTIGIIVSQRALRVLHALDPMVEAWETVGLPNLILES